ncbi:hypothetical protein ACFPRL_30650 [Pseudoclavibacter helvolus]
MIKRSSTTCVATPTGGASSSRGTNNHRVTAQTAWPVSSSQAPHPAKDDDADHLETHPGSHRRPLTRNADRVLRRHNECGPRARHRDLGPSRAQCRPRRHRARRGDRQRHT